MKKYAKNNSSVIRLSGNETIPFPLEIAEMTDTPEFQRLRGILQLGMTDLVYPGATHTRFSHSLGVYSKCLHYIDRLRQYPLFNELFGEKQIKALIFASLLHDTGHYPFAHYIEEIGGLKDSDTCHERFSRRIIAGELSVRKAVDGTHTFGSFSERKIEQLERTVREGTTIFEVLSKHAISEEIIKIFEGKDIYGLLKDVIDGPIDCDKLDYLIRDSNSVGVPYGHMIDSDRFYDSLTLDSEYYPKVRLAITSKGIPAVESIVSSRYELFSEVYWHKTCRAGAAMIKDAFWYARNNIERNEFETACMLFDDRSFLEWLAEKTDVDIAHDLLSGIKICNSRKIYKRIRTYSSFWKEERKIELYTNFTTKLNNDFTEIHAYKDRLIQMINDSRKKYDLKELRHHHLIIDIPNVHQDLYNRIRVEYPFSVEGSRFYDMQDVSQLCKALYETFAYSTKKVRIFCRPDLYEALEKMGSDLDEMIKEAFA